MSAGQQSRCGVSERCFLIPRVALPRVSMAGGVGNTAPDPVHVCKSSSPVEVAVRVLPEALAVAFTTATRCGTACVKIGDGSEISGVVERGLELPLEVEQIQHPAGTSGARERTEVLDGAPRVVQIDACVEERRPHAGRCRRKLILSRWLVSCHRPLTQTPQKERSVLF